MAGRVEARRREVVVRRVAIADDGKGGCGSKGYNVVSSIVQI